MPPLRPASGVIVLHFNQKFVSCVAAGSNKLRVRRYFPAMPKCSPHDGMRWTQHAPDLAFGMDR